MTIRQLPLQLANQIAAGEVVERPSSVVKELVENSIDAGATELLIDIEQGGAKRIRIRDNGSGIAKEELGLALSRHATSKIQCLDDLESIQSLGFRGEALASISSVSRLTLTSKPASQHEAWQAFCEGRDMQVQVQPAAHPDGTTVDVQDLFFNTPARRKFLRTEKTEFGHIDEVLRRIALAAPMVRIVLSHNKRKVRDYKPLRQLSDDFSQALPRLKAIAGSTFANQALFLQHQAERWQLHGWVAPAQHCRHQSDVQYMYVNGRMMKDKLLNHAIRQAYGEALADDRQPTYVLYLQVPAREVDVNVHPAKHEVRFHQARQIHDFMLQGLREALATASEQTQPSQLFPGVSAKDATLGYQPPAQHAYHQPRHAPGQDIAAGAAVYQNLMQPAKSQQPKTLGGNGVGAGTNALTAVNDTEQWQLLTLLEQRYLLLVRQTNAGHRLGTADLQTLQHALEQQRLGQKVAQGLSGQPLLLPVQLQLTSPLDEPTYQQLTQLGVQLKLIAADRAIVMQVPAMLRNQPVEQVIDELITKLVPGPLADQAELLSWLAYFCVQPAYSNEQGKYWFEQAAQLSHFEQWVQPLEWHVTHELDQ